jgi:hypothetical protein
MYIYNYNVESNMINEQVSFIISKTRKENMFKLSTARILILPMITLFKLRKS